MSTEQKKLLNSCPVCNATNFTTSDICTVDGPLLLCEKCGQLISQCTEDRYHITMQQFDKERVTLPFGASIKRAFRLHSKRLDLARKYCNNRPAQSIRLLDVGCSSGAFLLNAKMLGFNAEGVEPAKKAVDTAKSFNLNVHHGYLESINFADNTFDLITLFEVIEHLNDPNQLLKECHRILKPDGIMMIGTANTDSWTVRFMKQEWEYFNMDQHGGHISFFNSRSINKIANLSRFKVECIKTRCVKFYDKTNKNKILSTVTKIFAELLNIPSQIFGFGHDMIAVLRK